MAYAQPPVFGSIMPTAYGMSLVSQIRNIGINLNQLMPIAHANGEVPDGLAALIKKIETLLDRIIEKL